MEISNLLISAVVGLSDNIRHSCFNDLKAIFLQIALNLMICTGMEIQEIFSDDQNPWLLLATVIGKLLHPSDALLKTGIKSSQSMLFHAFHNIIHCRLKGPVAAALFLFIGADLAKQLLQNINHGKSRCQTNC